MLKSSRKIVVKYSRPVFGFMVVLGIVFLAIILASLHLYYSDAISVLASLGSSQYVIWFVLAGIVIITVGTVGLGRQHFKNHRSLLTLLMVVLVPLLTFAAVLFATSLMIAYAPMFPMRSEITEVIVVDSNPIVLSLSVKAITSRDSRIDSAIIKNSNETMVASFFSEELHLCFLPAGSEKTFTVDFNTTLPSGEYLVILSSWHDNHGSASFTIP